MSRARDTADQINRVNSSAADATAITVDSSENVGVGLTPSSWWSGMKAVETQASSGGVFASASVNGHFLTNAYYDGANWKHKNNGAAEYYSQTGGIHQFLIVSSGSAGNNITWSERVRIDSDGLKFHGDTAAANALNDYEEGTFTPTHTSGSGTGSFSDARYTKIGNTVHLYFTFSFTSGGGSLGIGGFPFNANGNSVGIGREDQTNGYGVYGRINSGNSTVYIYATQASSNASAYQVPNGAIKFAITYETSS